MSAVRQDAHHERIAMQISGYIALFASMILSRIVNERAFQKLSSTEKLRLMDGFSRSRAYSLVPLLVAMIVFWVLMTQTQISRLVLAIGYFGGLFLFVIVRSVLNQQKLRQLEMPPAYRQAFTASQFISVAGLAWFFFTIFSAG